MYITDDRYILGQSAIGRWGIKDGWRAHGWTDSWDSLSWGEGREPYTDLTTQLLYMMSRKRESRDLLTKGTWKC